MQGAQLSKETAEVNGYRASIQQADSKSISPVFLITKCHNLHETNQMFRTRCALQRYCLQAIYIMYRYILPSQHPQVSRTPRKHAAVFKGKFISSLVNNEQELMQTCMQ